MIWSWTSSDIISIGAGIFMLFLVLVMYYISKTWAKYIKKLESNIKDSKCSNCVFGGRKWQLTGNPPKQVCSSFVTCHLLPIKTTHNSEDWCSNFCPSNIVTSEEK